MRNTGEDAYFAASNSCHGFCNYYKECFDHPRIRHVYAVKGGPGTGKSRFLRDVAAAGEACGWECEYIYCSSDPDSLDGLILSRRGERIALMDATAPHVYEPTRPGVREDIVNLGAFWSSDRLVDHREEIESLSTEKAGAYRMCYRYLAGAGGVMENRRQLVESCIYRGRISRAAEKLTSAVKRGEGYDPRPALMGSLGMKGQVMLDTFCRRAEHLTVIEDCHGVADFLMDALLERCREKQVEVLISRDPVLPWRIEGLFLPRDKRAFVVCAKCDQAPGSRPYGTRRFLDAVRMRRVRGEVAYAERCYRAMVNGAAECLKKAEEAHFALEEIYIGAMDFEAKEAFTKDFCKTLFGLQS